MRADRGTYPSRLAANADKRYRHSAMQELFEAVRAACSSGVWSKAVELVRLFAVMQQSSQGREFVCRVGNRDQSGFVTVQLYPEDVEWDCDCESRAPCCEHVAAAVIALKKARTEGKALPDAMTGDAKLGYRFARAQGELALERFVVRSDGRRVPLKVSLATMVTQHMGGFDLAPTQEDLQLDRLIGSEGLVQPEKILSVLKLLAGHKNVVFEDRQVEVMVEPLRPRATISAVETGWLVELRPDPSVQEIVASSVAWTSTTLAPLAATEYCGAKYQKLVPTRVYGPEEIDVLLTEVLPELKRWFVVELQTDQLPEVTNDERPRVVIQVDQRGDELRALATLVYGDPPIARIDKNRLVHLGGPVPIRKVELERRAMEQVRQSLGLGIGTWVVVSGRDARSLAAKLDRWHGEIRGSDRER
jgi:hypothetical protein